MVEVDEEQREVGGVVVGMRDFILQAHVEVAAVEEASQVVETSHGPCAQCV